MSVVQALLSFLGLGVLVASAGFSVIALFAVLLWMTRRKQPPLSLEARRPITLLKPLCGPEPDLYRHLRSFCEQEYPQFQIVFGVRDPNDAALTVVKRLLAEFPDLAIDLVIDPRQHGDNYKISNLMNMFDKARHDVLVIADSDAVVGPDYLAAVTAPLIDAKVGLVTCAYRSRPTQAIWSRLGAMYVNEWFMPSVLLARLFGHEQYASGQTLCIRRTTLQAIGGLQAIANHIADDFRLGELVRELGLRVVLSDYEVEVNHHEPNAKALLRHEMRWMRTLRVVRPQSFRVMFLSFSLPLAVVGLLLALLGANDNMPVPLWLFAITAGARFCLHVMQRLNGGMSVVSDLWLVPARDFLLSWIWWRSFSNSTVTWRGTEFAVDAQGMMRRVP
ncbi:MAG TPA: bacteriohopanetetrol glucosamine biosynthesis glycosyltransferase HpnI [Steroidobacteraceae bacterium]|jgi:ceramide glucosyltransferase|nr:bacteriohopanetetrol glucosamine biosynthesis glycosyltransferase HpnI [Steroidobacteraceae bacterium]